VWNNFYYSSFLRESLSLRWRDAPKDYGIAKKIYNRFIRWCKLGVFDLIFRTPWFSVVFRLASRIDRTEKLKPYL